MINYTKLIPWIIIAALLAFILISRSCEGETKTIRIPAVVNELPSQPPIYLKPETAPLPIIWESPTETISIPVENPVNDSLVLAYQKLEDSLERFKLYLDAVSIRRFENTFEDEYLKLTMLGEVQGHLNYIKPTYTIKEREIEIPNKKWSLSIYGGYGIGKSGLSPQVGIGVAYDLFSF